MRFNKKSKRADCVFIDKENYCDEYDKHDEYNSNKEYDEGCVYDDRKNFSRPNSNNKSPILIILVVLIIIIQVVIVSYLFNKISDSNNESKGKKAVMSLYNFNTVSELADNLDNLKSIMTEECYYNTTVLNASKSLNTYLKLKQKRTEVTILDSKPGYVLYKLTNENISPNRLFIFTYELNLFGKIDYVREFEAIDFYTQNNYSTNGDMYDIDSLLDDWDNK